MVNKDRSVIKGALVKLLLEDCRKAEGEKRSPRGFTRAILEYMVGLGVRYKSIIKSCPVLNLIAKRVYHFILEKWL
jgi:hypothetical protein